MNNSVNVIYNSGQIGCKTIPASSFLTKGNKECTRRFVKDSDPGAWVLRGPFILTPAPRGTIRGKAKIATILQIKEQEYGWSWDWKNIERISSIKGKKKAPTEGSFDLSNLCDIDVKQVMDMLEYGEPGDLVVGTTTCVLYAT